MGVGSFLARLRGETGAGGAARVETLPLHLYGKLPIYKDFISSGLAEPGARAFREWLDTGFSRRWSTRDEYKGGEIPLHTFLLSLPEGRRTIAGVVWGSSDEGGLRQFPFTAFSVLPAGRPAASSVAALAYLDFFAERAAAIRRDYQSGKTVGAFYEAYRGAQISFPVESPETVRRQLLSALEDVPLGDFARSLLGEEAPRLWPGFLAALGRAFGSAHSTGGALRIPVGPYLPRELQLQLWIAWLERCGVLEPGAVKGLLVQRGEGGGRATLLFRDLAPDDILLLHPSRSDYEGVEEVPIPVATAANGPQEQSRTDPPGWERPLVELVDGGSSNP